MSGHGTPDLHFGLAVDPPNPQHLRELTKVKQELELLKTMDPFRVVEMAVEIQTERIRVVEAMNARDAVVQRLSDAYVSLRQKTAAIERLQQEQEAFQKHGLAYSSKLCAGTASGLVETSKLKAEIITLEETVKSLREEVKFLKEATNRATKSLDPPPRYDDGRTKNDIDHTKAGPHSQLIRTEMSRIPFRVLRDPQNTLSIPSSQSASPIPAEINTKHIVDESNDLDYRVIHSSPKLNEPEEMIKARNTILAALPLPTEIPDDSLQPIVIPSPFTLHEFLGNASGSLRSSLSNYRVLQQLTTSWCSEREEHGYFLTPAFKCSTNPRVATAHRWTSVDVVARMSKRTECFYNKDGIWYYAGIYRAFRLEDLTTKEWEALSTETTQIIIKDTISGRKNTSPQNLYETSQLYAAGALKVACVALQCVGFNKTMYRAILEQATKCALSGKWKGNGSTGGGLEAGAVWNANDNGAGDVVDGMLGMSLGGRLGNMGGNENIPAEGDDRTKR